MYFSGGVTLELLLTKRRDKTISSDSLARQSELYNPAKEKSLSFSACEGGIEKMMVERRDNIGN